MHLNPYTVMLTVGVAYVLMETSTDTTNASSAHRRAGASPPMKIPAAGLSEYCSCSGSGSSSGSVSGPGVAAAAADAARVENTVATPVGTKGLALCCTANGVHLPKSCLGPLTASNIQ
ncbi:hypothetical protein CH63R_03511 [Colletotrichum higginsianum IMI 349063]|uniref:Uncharacterized protein n=1 Tax=Colletotrichum higginsianum (strain IMI 349063) TaxID=759273 RepID=A0A1B7YRV5_COLHI|nr:hypothetical protein CH63R_03511 [Colletotrichum higginsianum IMI 349063]OBR14785.1 hypothetical protein CH63R_03511 [Colletotrichum higginsianum IMI 349063]